MDDEDFDFDDDSNKRRSTTLTREPENKRRKTSTPPKWFKDWLASQKKDEESEEDEDYEAVDDDAVDDEDEEYFEEDITKLCDTVTKHVLSNFTRNQRKALKSQVKKGVDEGFSQLKELVRESMEALISETPTRNLWKLGLGPKEIKKYSAELDKLRGIQDQKKVTIKRVLDAPLDRDQRRKLLNVFDVLQTLDVYSPEYLALSTQINSLIENAHTSNFTPEQMESFSKKEEDLKKLLSQDLPLRIRILNADIDDSRKAAIYEKYTLLQKTPDDSVTAASLEEWIEEALKTPYTKVKENMFNTKNPGEALLKLKAGFQEELSEMSNVVEPLLTVFNNRMQQTKDSAGKHPSLVIGLLGSPGVGKTAVGQVIAKVWGLPFQQISLGGIVDSSILDGQHSGWVGSNPGRFAKALQAMGVVNGVLFLDEIDKLGETPHGLQVQYSLLHSTDPIQNDNFHDHYLGPKLPLDLSQTLIICALNKTQGLDPALLSRMHIIKVPDYTDSQKTNIMRKHLFPIALKDAGLTSADIELPAETCDAIQKEVTKHVGKEGGVRGVKACIRMIVDKLSLLLRTTEAQKQELGLSFKVDVSSRPVKITPSMVGELYGASASEDDENPWGRMYI